jgi:hypothetical protein
MRSAVGILGRGSVCCMQGRDFQCVYVILGGRVYSVYTVVVGLHDQPDLKWEEQIRNLKYFSMFSLYSYEYL